MSVTVQNVAVPDFGRPSGRTPLDRELFENRIARFQERLVAGGFAAAVVYADREHSANIRYLTGFDPRFEEAILVLTVDGGRRLILGNECLPAPLAMPIDCEAILYQDLSLPGQDRSLTTSVLAEILAESGLKPGMRVAVLGWKPLSGNRIEIPHYIVTELQRVVGTDIHNANDILMGVNGGLRHHVEPEQLADFEFAACAATDSLFRAILALRPGVREFEIAAQYDARGVEQSSFPLVNFGPDIPYALKSPGNRRLETGDYVGLALGIWGSNACRVGMAVYEDPAADERGRDYMKLVRAYLETMRSWYQALADGVKAGAVFAAADAARDPKVFQFALNPGHYIHYDEWSNSPFAAASEAVVASPTLLQSDIIPAHCEGAVNMEDTLAVVGKRDREILAERFPELVRRCRERREFMRKTLGYSVNDDILPLGNLPGVFFPYLLDSRKVCVFG